MSVPAYGDWRARAGHPRARRSPLEGGVCPQAGRSPLGGGVCPRAGRSPLEGGVCPRAGRSPLEGGVASSEAEPARGDLRVGRLGGPSGPPWRGPCPVCLTRRVWPWLFAGFKWGFPSCLRGPPGLSPTVAPEHLWVRRPGSRRCWSLLIGRSFPLACDCFPWGRVSGPAGLAPEAL
jgi:hypothetical protein